MGRALVFMGESKGAGIFLAPPAGRKTALQLESALFRPQSGYYDDIVWEACALLESVAVNHPFVDGNKRVAFAVMYAFLRINDHVLEGDAMKIYRKMIGLFEGGKFDIAELEKYFRPLIHAL